MVEHNLELASGVGDADKLESVPAEKDKTGVNTKEKKKGEGEGHSLDLDLTAAREGSKPVVTRDRR